MMKGAKVKVEDALGSLREGIGKNRRRKNDHQGFTLVELIVVIVVLAILAAILVPALVGWIDKAKTKRYEAEIRSIYLAAEASFVEGYARGFEGSVNENIIGFRGNGKYTIPSGNNNLNWLAYIEEMSGISDIKEVKIYVNGGKIKALIVNYTSPSDDKELKAYKKEPGYNDSDGAFTECFKDSKTEDGLWHFYDTGKGQPIS